MIRAPPGPLTVGQDDVTATIFTPTVAPATLDSTIEPTWERLAVKKARVARPGTVPAIRMGAVRVTAPVIGTGGRPALNALPCPKPALKLTVRADPEVCRAAGLTAGAPVRPTGPGAVARIVTSCVEEAAARQARRSVPGMGA